MTNVFKWVGISVVVVLMLFLGLGCINKPIKIGEIKSIKLLNLDLPEIDLEPTIEIENPNLLPITVSDFDLEIWLNGTYLGVLKAKENIKIKSKYKGTITVPVKAVYKGNILRSFGLILNLFQNDKVQYKIKGFVKGKVLSIGKKIKVDQTGSTQLLKH